MKYYKVVNGDAYDHKTGWTAIMGELLTEHERNTRFPSLRNNCFNVVEVSKRKVYFSFGVRFDMGE